MLPYLHCQRGSCPLLRGWRGSGSSLEHWGTVFIRGKREPHNGKAPACPPLLAVFNTVNECFSPHPGCSFSSASPNRILLWRGPWVIPHNTIRTAQGVGGSRCSQAGSGLLPYASHPNAHPAAGPLQPRKAAEHGCSALAPCLGWAPLILWRPETAVT